ncbi:MAG: Accessory gene regulator protein A [Firmicutes bacterium ADurb.Bin419]|nr:MAG: Accessory gene regulator protein A [Firmicutes bacterium ADurb.Bin419]
MLPIIICEDNDIQRENFKSFIKDILIKEDYSFEIKLCTSSVDKVKDYVDNIASSGIYFLDIDLKSNINGIRLAEYIRKEDPRGYIIFITSHSEMSFLTFKYKVEALDFIIKDNLDEIKSRIEQCLKYIHEIYYSKTSNNNILILKNEDCLHHVDINNVIFIETSTNAHKIIIHEEKRQFEVSGNLKDIAESLGSNFYRSHRAYLINKKKICEVDKKNRIIHMTNGEQCLASFRYIGGLIK